VVLTKPEKRGVDEKDVKWSLMSHMHFFCSLI
jgi:hypothetical protein